MAEGTSRSRPPPSNGGRGRRRRAAKGVLPSARLRGSPWTGLPRSKPSSGARHPCRSSWKAARATRDYIRHGINTVSPRRGSPPATSPLATDRGAGPGVPATGRPGLPSQELHLAVTTTQCTRCRRYWRGQRNLRFKVHCTLARLRGGTRRRCVQEHPMPGPAPGRPRPGARLNWRIRTLATSCGDPSHPSVWTKPAPRFSPEPTPIPPKTGQ